MPGPLVLLALALVCSRSFAVGRSASLHAWVLKPGRSIGEIRPVLIWLRFVSALTLLILIALVAIGRRAD